MIKIVSNHNKQDVTYTYTVGQTFPKVEGKLISVEISGKELAKWAEEKNVPIGSIDNVFLSWTGKRAGGTLKELKELFDK